MEQKNKMKKPICAGILAHVDAGKTTLSEAMLFLSGEIKKAGRVDHRDSFLDNHELERRRGITIFSKQALFELENNSVCLLDTPGHADFSAEAERTLQILDCAVLVISGTDGVQAHTETIWRMLRRYRLPVFIFVSKMDLPGAEKDKIISELQTKLSDGCVDFTMDDNVLPEHLAMCSEKAMDKYLTEGKLEKEDILELIVKRRLFPCFFGSGLKMEGIEGLLKALDEFAEPQKDMGEFAAKVYKIGRDEKGERLSYMKITGGSLKPRSLLKYSARSGDKREEKITQIRLYSGDKYTQADEVSTGQVCAVLGLTETYPGQGLGAEEDTRERHTESVLRYRIILPPNADPALMLPKLRLLQEEDPELNILWNEKNKDISVELMGKVQTEVFISLVKSRFDTDISLDSGHIMYKETIAEKVEGVGHFEPLRHYAEVHLLMEPLPQGSGIQIDSLCSEDELDRNWQRLILSHITEKQHLGTLTGSPITDMKISLASGRAHLKHTEGGDFRQAVYRGIRQGLMNAKMILLEPYYSFSLELPAEQIGRAISDIRAMNGELASPEGKGDMMVLKGSAPVSAMNGYSETLMAYSRGRGRLSCVPDGYRPCKRQDETVKEIGYAPESDLENTADSVFCAHGAGFNVKWNRVSEYMHLESCLKTNKSPETETVRLRRQISIDDRELEAIMEREFGPIKRPSYNAPQINHAPASISAVQKKDFIIVDGYNLIFAWDELKALAAENLDLARSRLMDYLSNFCGFTKAELVLVFDGFRTPGNPGSRDEYHNIKVAFTKDGETADAFIEKLADEIGRNYRVRVITSDNLIRLSALRSGVLRTSSAEFIGEIQRTMEQISKVLEKSNFSAHMMKVKDGKR